ncbi:right-handed parallel beta-helix repeat-containing protein [Pseudonocardia sp. DSM 110487]|uniref:right-handed parallel beta-helix repeat-containing protein n=1 Tax=Pseudonocardia sp. DSM 110487 TaxID=2865833 RepID=UPI001C699C76|nr:right-handed parallel beta-helix repeat-containing protein [Pseudonocardia sp. DSM 110487]QYN37201.1 right-handed parallel beta-helix repeat-containing protein [Pseudonocardia sp. DSM 110487]
MNTSQITARAALVVATLVVLGGAIALAVIGSIPPEPQQLVRQELAAAVQVDPARPCTREAPEGPAAAAQEGVQARFDPAQNAVVLSAGQGVTLPALAQAVGNPDLLREEAPGEWLLGADLAVLPGTSVQIAAPTTRWLKLLSTAGRYASVKAFGGNIDVSGACITSWDPAKGTVDTEPADGRGYLLARDGTQMTIDNAEIRYLGHGEVESYGLSWRTEGTGGKITNSLVSHNYFGLYSYEVGGLVVADNEFHDNILYGIDPHTGSHNLTIERNIVHDNGKHGIILAEDCTDNVIRDNIVYRNNHHGIVVYLRSNGNTIEGNDTFANAAQGINVNESNDNVISDNRVYDNTESGIGITQTSQNNLVENNQSRGNQQDGIRVVSEAALTTLRANTLGENGRYGVYVDIDGDVDIAGNLIFANRSGIMLKGSAVVPDGDNAIFDNREASIIAG